jgi:hypothetical protein
MDGRPAGRECGMQSSQPSRWESSEIDGQAERPKGVGANESIILSRGLDAIRDSRIAYKDGFRDTP